MRIPAVAALIVWCSTGAALAAAKTPITERVIALHPGGVVQLESTGKAVFANLLMPDATRIDYWLAERMLQQPMTFSVHGEDRYGRTLITSDIEADMLRDGVAMIYASEGTIPGAWRAAERNARAKHNGVWSVKERQLTPENAAQHIGAFALVDGTVTRVYEGKRFTAINFGEDWREDFSITIPAKLRRSMKGVLSQIKPGARVTVRGMLHTENGPMVTLSHLDNMEIR
jgi:hypothetical protein